MSTTKSKILLAEDDATLGELLKNYLELNDFEVLWCKDGIEAYKQFNRNHFDICLLDVMMPEMNGFHLAGEIKQLKPMVPFIFLTAKALKEDVLKGYQTGADDYIVKPFDSELLVFKINAILKRTATHNPGNTTQFDIGKYKFNSNTQVLQGPGGQKRLSARESEMLKLLCQHKNNLLPRSVALKTIWQNDDYFSGRSMDVYITKIRKYLSDDPSLEILNIHGKGFRLSTESFGGR